jgi:methylaspartate ammonia-lyase
MNILDYILHNFSSKELEIYRQRMHGNRTLEEVGKEFGVTRERIRQVESKVQDKTKYFKLDIEVSIDNLAENRVDELSTRTQSELRELGIIR